jgi:tRNA (adenine57-N1/adenine58-N1)-methyltransferase
VNDEKHLVKAGDLAQLIGPRGKKFIVKIAPGEHLQTHQGMIKHADLIGSTWGRKVRSHLGKSFMLLQPSLNDILLRLKRTTTIMYPKDIGFILVNMGIGPGQQIIEAGTGSGALTIALAHAVGPGGRVFSYEARAKNQNIARQNLESLGLLERVELKQRDIDTGFDEHNADALFLDLPNPYDYLPQVRAALKPGGFFGSLLPTTNQVIGLLKSLEIHHFGFAEVLETSLRYYTPVAKKFRPKQRMVAHTGYLIFARPLEAETTTKKQSLDSKGD